MNFFYGRDFIKFLIEVFVKYLLENLILEVIVLVNNVMEIKWF